MMIIVLRVLTTERGSITLHKTKMSMKETDQMRANANDKRGVATYRFPPSREAAAPVARASKHLSLWIDLSVFEKFFWDIQFE